MSVSPGSGGSLLAPVTSNEDIPESASAAETVATSTNLWLGGNRLQFAPGSPEITGGVLSIFTVRVLGDSWLPALSMAKNVRVVVPSAEMVTEVVLPATLPDPVWAPVRLKSISFTPLPPGSLSVEFRVTATLVLFQPAALGPGEAVATVTGGVVSRAGTTMLI